ncbi:UNVERIFIED_CONTAM: hypothetical protein Sindi_2438400 [Sesamum indicum]
MVFVRQDRHMNMPPPQYHPDTDSITLSLHYNGVARHIPEAVYVGGRVSKYDYVSPQEINIETLNLFCDSLGLGKDRAFYIIVNKGFKLLIDNNDMMRAWRRIRKNDREMMIYVEVMVGEGAVEIVEEGEGVAQIVEEGTGVAETEMGEGGEEPFTFLGAEVNEGEGEGAEGEGAGAEGEGEGVEGDDLVDSDYEGVEGELEVGGENVGVERESGRVEGENDSDEEDGRGPGDRKRLEEERAMSLQPKRKRRQHRIKLLMRLDKLKLNNTKERRKRKATEPTTEPEIEQLGQATSSGSRHTNILPPLQVQDEDEQPEACLTQDQMQPAPVPPLPVFMPGPSMFEQLHMNNPGTTLQSRVTIRAPPPFRGRQILPLFSTRPQTEASEAILKEGGQKFLKLNK